MYIEFSEKIFCYRRFNYHKRRIKKSDLETQLMNYQLLKYFHLVKNS